MKKKFEKHPMIPIFITVLFGFIGFSLPIPIFSPLFLSPQYHFLPTDFSLELRTILLGVVLAIYPFGQFLGAPLLGQLSDRYGRKPILIFSHFGTLIGYILSAIALSMASVWLLALSRFICGYSEGNFSIAQAAVADFAEGRQKNKHFGLINMAAGLGFVIGPIIGGKLTDKDWISWLNDAVPFWFSAFLSLFTVGLILWQFIETNQDRKKKPFHVFSGLINLKKGLDKPHLKILYIINFFLFFGTYLFFQFYPSYLVKIYQYDASDIANVCAYLAIVFGVAQIAIVYPLSKHIHPRKAAIWGSAVLAVLLVYTSFQEGFLSLLITIPLIAIAIAIGTTNFQVLLSNSIPRDEQGEIMGTAYSIRVATEVMTSLLGGVVAGILIGLPILLGGAFVLLSVLVLIKKTKKETAYL